MQTQCEKIPSSIPSHIEPPSKAFLGLLEQAENYFCLFGGRKVVVLSGSEVIVKDEQASHKRDVKSVILISFKIISWATGFIPFSMYCLQTGLYWYAKRHSIKVLSHPPLEQVKVDHTPVIPAADTPKKELPIQSTSSSQAEKSPQPPTHPVCLQQNSPQQRPFFAFGDEHGELEGFQEELEHANLINSVTKNWQGGSAIALQVGDVIDRGPLSKEAYAYNEKLQEQAHVAGGLFERLLGNHELMLIQGIFLYVDFTNIPDPNKMAKKIKEDIINGKVQLAYTYGSRLYTHAGCRSAITEMVNNAVTGQEASHSPVDLQKIVDHLNKLLIDAVTKNDFSHPIFQAGLDRGGNQPFGGPLWQGHKGMLQSVHARDIPQGYAHTPPAPGECLIRITDSMRLINLDVGLCKAYGGNRGYLKIADGYVTAFEKVKGVWQKFEQKDKLQQKQDQS